MRASLAEKRRGDLNICKEADEDIDVLLGLLSDLRNDLPKTSANENEWMDKLLQVPDIEKLLKTEMKRDEQDRKRKDKLHRTQVKLSHLEQREAEYRRRIELDQEARVHADRDHYERGPPQTSGPNKVRKAKNKKKGQSNPMSVMFRADLGMRETTPMSKHHDRQYWSTQKLEADKRSIKLKEEYLQYEEDKRRELELQQELAELRIQEKKNQQQRDIERKREGREERTERAQKRVAAARAKKIRDAEEAGFRRAQQIAKVDEEKSKREEFRAGRRDMIMKVVAMPNLRSLIINRLRQNGQEDGRYYHRQPRSVRGSPRSLDRDDVTDWSETTPTQSKREGNRSYEGVDSSISLAAGSAIHAARCRHDPVGQPARLVAPKQSIASSFEASPFGMAAKLAEAAFSVAAASSQVPDLVFDDSTFRRAAAESGIGPISEKTEPSSELKPLIPEQFKSVPSFTPSPQRSRSAGRARDERKSASVKPRSRPQSAGRSCRKTVTRLSHPSDFTETRQEWKSENLLDKPRKVSSSSPEGTTKKHSVKSVSPKNITPVKGGWSAADNIQVREISPVGTSGAQSSSSSRLVKKLLDLLEEEQAVSPCPSTQQAAIYSPDFLSPAPTVQAGEEPRSVGERQLARIKAAIAVNSEEEHEGVREETAWARQEGR